MSKVDIDYSNTLFYKISCKDTNITDLYIGHTTNFVQRKSGHKQGCNNPKYANYNCKLYNVIRHNGGWDNWRMDIIAYHECKDLYEARKKEQEYFILYNATLNSIEPMPRPKCVNNQTPSNPNDVKTKHNCDICNFSCFNTQDAFNLHLTRNRHIKAVSRLNRLSANVSDKLQKIGKEYKCEMCNFKCSKQSDWNRHIMTRKHTSETNVKQNETVQSLHKCTICNDVFNSRTTLWRHTTRCKTRQPTTHMQTETIDTALVIELLKQNQEFKALIIAQNKQMMELANKAGNTNCNNNNNTTNNKFNLNVFLNETCKDAISMDDFIKSIEVTRDEFIHTGQVGFIEGISTVMAHRFRDMDVHTRPLHCTDLKRETIYIKNADKWEKDDADKTNMRKAVRGVAKKNMKELWRWYNDNKPAVEQIGTDVCEDYFKYHKAALGGYGKEEDLKFEEKIMRNVLKEVHIDKSTSLTV